MWPYTCMIQIFYSTFAVFFCGATMYIHHDSTAALEPHTCWTWDWVVKCGLAAVGQHTMSTSRPKIDSNIAFWLSQWRHSAAQFRNRVFHTHEAAWSKCLSPQINITYLLQYPVYAINRTMFFTYEWFRFWDSGILCENAVVALNLYTISWSNLHSLCEVVCSCKAMQSEQNKQRICKSSHKFETSNCNTLSMRARVGTSYLWVPVNLAQCRSKESVFHLMLQNSCTKYWPKLWSNEWPIILGAGLYTTCRGQRVLIVIRLNATFLPLRPYCEKIFISF